MIKVKIIFLESCLLVTSMTLLISILPIFESLLKAKSILMQK